MAKAIQTADTYIAARSAPVRKILTALRALVLKTLPDATEAMKWGAPVFLDAGGKPIVYLYGGKSHAHLGFIQGAKLDDPKGVLVGQSKTGRHVKLLPGERLPRSALAVLLKQCVALK